MPCCSGKFCCLPPRFHIRTRHAPRATLPLCLAPCALRPNKMSSFDSNIAKMEQTLRRALTQEERRLLKLWDLTCQSAARGNLQPEAPAPPPVDETTYTGRFKVVATKGYYEVYFVCG